MEEIAIIIPSHKRAGRVTTHRLIAGAKVCIPESQRHAYLQFHDEAELVCHPDSIKGISPKRQWILEKYKSVVMVDDDLQGCTRLWRIAGDNTIRSNLSPTETRDMINATADTARSLGAFLFGWNTHCSPMTHSQLRTFRFGGFIMGGAIGILSGSKLFFPNSTLPVDDYFVCLLNHYYHRFSYADCRFAFGFKDTYVGQGGCAESRADNGERKAFAYLRHYFGDCVQRKTMNHQSNHKPTKMEKNEFGRIMRIPWKY